MARIEEDCREMTYRFYVTTCLQNIPQQKYTTVSFYDMLYPKLEDNRSAEEIAADVIAKAGLIVR